MEAMKIEEALVADEARSLLAVVQGSCAVRNRAGLVTWLQGEIQDFIPHDLVIVAWGNFPLGAISFDIIPSGRPLGSLALEDAEVRALLTRTFEHWVEADQLPVALDMADLKMGSNSIRAHVPWLTAAVAHGLKDRRGHYDCVYLFIGRAELATRKVRNMVHLLLPSIDAGSRQTALVQQQDAAVAATRPAQPERPRHGGTADSTRDSERLSAREVEVMGWVRMGKTNSEIALIMNLSTFTIKNHMRRIYKKLDVLNRAQAVGRLGTPAAL
jgi:transcriptional regulator EpsA